MVEGTISSGKHLRISSRTYPFLVVNMCMTELKTELFRCFAHVVNLANVDVMGHITKLAAVETATAIWEYDPSLPNNHVLGGSLDVIASICTIAVKVHAFDHDSGYLHYFSFSFRFRLPDSESSTSTNFSSSASLHSHLRFPSTAISDGEQHIACLTARIRCVR
jgi:hypothetical protein